MSKLQHLDGVSLVYFVQAINNGPIKIGHTENLTRRYTMLRAGSPYALVLLGVIQHAKAKTREAYLHRRFATAQLHADWFHPTVELTTYIETNATSTSTIVDADAEVLDGVLAGQLVTDVDHLLMQLDDASELAALWTVEQLAVHMNVAPATVLRYVRAGTVPCIRIGRQIRFCAPAVTAYLVHVSSVVDTLQE